MADRASALPPSATRPATAFALRVALLGERGEPFVFDQDRVRVGRGRDADLRLEHAGISREQFDIERSIAASGEPRFRIVPAEMVTNPTHVNGHPAVEGALKPGDTIAVAEVRIVLERVDDKKKRSAVARASAVVAGAGEATAPKILLLRAVLLGATVIMAAVVGYLVLFDPDDGAGANLVQAQTPLFGKLPEPRCGNPIECDTKAHETYERGRSLMAGAGADPGNLYRATLEFARARSYREQSGRPLGDIADVDARAEAAKRDAEAAFDDARFALRRAIAASDLKRCEKESALLARIVPDDGHPYRIILDAYRRTLPRGGKSPASGEGDEK